MSDAEAAAYAAPYPDERYKSGVRRFPNLVPDRPDAGGAALSRRARDFWSNDWAGKSFMAIGMQDPVLGPPAMRMLLKSIRNCPPPLELPDAGHFVQEAGRGHRREGDGELCGVREGSPSPFGEKVAGDPRTLICMRGGVEGSYNPFRR